MIERQPPLARIISYLATKMPIYEYRCSNCEHELEALQKLSDPVLSDCPECEQPALKKQLSAPGFRLAGSGWYETDFKSGDNKKNLAGDKDAKKATDKSTKKGQPDKKSDKKSDSKRTSKSTTESNKASA